MEIWGADPRVQKENTGAERVEATKLGIANLLRSLAALDKATGGDDVRYAATYHQMLTHHLAFLNSVPAVIAGVMHKPASVKGSGERFIEVNIQRAAVQYMLTDAPLSLEPYKSPEILFRAQTIGGIRAIEELQAGIVTELLAGSRLSMLESQKGIDPSAYGVIAFADDMADALWGDLTTAPHFRRVLQIAFLDKVREILQAVNGSREEYLMAKMAFIQGGVSPAFAGIAAATGTNTAFPAWARNTLPKIKSRLDAAKPSSRSDRLHFEDMAWRIGDIIKIRPERQ